MARGLRAVPRAARARTASGRGRSGPTRCSGASRRRIDAARARARARRAVPPVPAVARGHAVDARRGSDAHGVALFGDLPFMVDGDSADVWARQHQFRLDASVGAPPDAFSATGQDWGMPVYRWDAHRGARTSAGCASARGAAPICSTATASITSSASIAPTAAATTAARPFFTPADEADAARARRAGARRVPRAPAPRSSPRISAPCPTSSARRWRASACPGFRVFRWERRLAHARGSRSAIRRSIRASRSPTSGTHDTEPMAVWWETAPPSEREAAELAARRRSSG